MATQLTTSLTKNLSCHVIGLNPSKKKEFVQELTKKNGQLFNIIDLDTINQQILKDPELDKMFAMYSKLKADKNDKFKEVDKKMSQFWETNFVQKIEDKVKQKKTNILIGMNNHYKSLTRKIPIECTNKFIIKVDPEEDTKEIIRYNLETYKEDIISGNFPLEYINYEYLLKKRQTLETSYMKIGYIEKTVDQLKTILNMIEKSNNVEMWVAMKEPYNIGSLIHPINNDKIVGFNDMNMALLSSINFIDGEVKKEFTGKEISLKELKPKGLNKLKTKRFVYLVESGTFIPDETGKGHKYFSQLPVKILAKDKIDSVHKHFIENK